MSNLVLRFGSLAVGIVLARMLTPEQFGVYAVALTVQAILMTLADLGLSADLIRADDPAGRAPTVATLGLLTGIVMTAIMATAAHALADSMNSPAAGDVILILSFTLLLGGAGVVPMAMMQRRFEQKKIFLIAVIDFVVGTSVTFALLLCGWGVSSLAVGRLAAQVVTLILQFILSGERPRYGLDRSMIGPVAKFGLPIAGANLLSWALLNIDNVVISRVVGPVALGFYVLAFNISSWPMTAIGQVIRSVALPAFARSGHRQASPVLQAGTAVAWALALPAGAFIAILSSPLIVFVYGPKWEAAAPVLAALGCFGALRAVFDLFVSFLLAKGSPGWVLIIQVVWFVVLIPAIIGATILFGIVGAGWVHLIVAVVIVLPLYLVALHRAGVEIRSLGGVIWQPIAAMIVAGGFCILIAVLLPTAGFSLLGGASVGGIVYLALLYRWLRSRIRSVRAAGAGEPRAPLGVEPFDLDDEELIAAHAALEGRHEPDASDTPGRPRPSAF